MLCGKALNITGIVSLCEQQSAAIHIHNATVWVSSGKIVTKMRLFVPLFLSDRLYVTTREILTHFLEIGCF